MRVATVVPPSAWTVAAICLLSAAAPAQSPAPSPSAAPAPVAAGATADRDALCLREGTRLVDELGHFQTAGDRLLFVADEGQQRFTLLENLNLERIVRALGEGDRASEWRVAGSVTEYRGANYLLLERAVLVSSSHSAGTAQASRQSSPAGRSVADR